MPKLTLKSKRVVFLIAAASATIFLIVIAAALLSFIRRNDNNSPTVASLPEGATAQALRLTVTQTGIAVVTAAQLAQANLPADPLQTENLSLTRDGQPVPYLIQDEAIYFYAEAVTRTLEAPAVYWLAPGEGVAMPEIAAAADGEGENRGRVAHTWEENSIFVSLARSDDVWFGELLNAGESIDLDLTDIQPLAEEATLTVRLWSNNESEIEPDHHLVVSLNGEQIGEHFWDGKSQETVAFTVAGGLLQPEGNTLTLALPGDTGALGEQVYLDWVRLEYERTLDLAQQPLLFSSQANGVQLTQADENSLVLDVSRSQQPSRITEITASDGSIRFGRPSATARNAQYAAANPAQAIQPLITIAPTWESSLTDAAAGADYLVVYANEADFLETLQPLLDYRQSQEMQVRAVDVMQVYDEFSYGRPTSEGIREFLLTAAATWNPAPRFVLLVGDASYDFNNYTAGKNRNILPTHLVFTEFMGFVASDTWFVIPPDGSLAPQMAIGRFPAQTADQLETMVAKTLIYEREADPAWSGRALLVSDDEVYFDTTSDALAVSLTDSGFDPQKLYMTEKEDIHEDIMAAINDGVGLVNYVGHGSVEVWGDERVLKAEDAAALRNRGRFPIFTTFTCLNGYFNHPDVDALAETLLTAPNGGIVAAIAPSSRTTTYQQFQVADIFFAQLLTGQVTTLGEALQIAKQENAENGNARDVIYSYNLLGDPALHFHLP